jgi:hypothetical protein
VVNESQRLNFSPLKWHQSLRWRTSVTLE